MIKTTVFNEIGRSVSLALRKELTVEQAKNQALSELASDFRDPRTMKSTQQYKLVSMKSGRSLNDSKRLEDEKLYQNDELLLLRRSVTDADAGCSTSSGQSEKPAQKTTQQVDEEKFKAPTLQEIDAATAHTKPVDIDRTNGEPPPKGQHKNEVSKIMVTLVEYSEIMLRDHPDIKPIFVDLQQKIDCPVEIAEPTVDANLLKQLSDMGFEESLAKRALIARKSNSTEALELLLSGQYENVLSDLPQSGRLQTTPKAFAMLQCFQEYRRRMFKTNSKAAEYLMSMGFPEDDVLDALHIHSNNQEAACNWLLSDRKATAEHFAKGLDCDGVIYKAIVANPVVQLGLCSPKVLLALLRILEYPHCISRWINDADTAPLLSHLFRIYHSEKASLQVQ